MKLCVLCASSRAGNSAEAVRLTQEAVAATAPCGTVQVDVIHLHEHPIAPCTACGECAKQTATNDGTTIRCILDTPHDAAASLFARMAQAHGLLVIAPVYFYGLPAPLKALVDRAQRFWALPQADRRASPLRPAFALLPAARTQGPRLFDGSQLTLKPFCNLLGFQLRRAMGLRGLEGPTDLAQRGDLCAHVRELAVELVWDAAKVL